MDSISLDYSNLCSVNQLIRYSSQNSLDESSQKQISKERTSESQIFKSDIHSSLVLEELDLMRKKKNFCDIILVADDIEVSAHRVVLSASSPYFCAMFSNFEEKKKDRIAIREVEGGALESLIEYIYNAEIEVTEKNVQSLLPAASLLQLTQVKDFCCNFLENQLHPSNCLGIRAFADLHGCLDLQTKADAYAEEYFSEVIESDEFKLLDINQLIQLIRSDKLKVPSEEEVFECVMSWVKYDYDLRKELLPHLMEHVRLPLIDKNYLIYKVEPAFRESDRCKDFLIEALKYHLLDTEKRNCLENPRTIPRKANSSKFLLVIGGQAPKAIHSVESYDFKREKWTVLSEMPSRRCRSGVATMDNNVFAVGGFNGSLRVKTVYVYDTDTDQWTLGVSMLARRSTLGVAVLNDRIYAVGGFDGATGLETAEMFNPITRVWSPIANMSTRRSSVGVTVLNDVIYAIGGYDGASRQCLSSVEYYDPSLDRWASVADMTCKRSGAGVGVMDGILYVVGGHDGPEVRKTVECYDPRVGKWKSVSSMSYNRRNAGVVSYDGKLYAVGGDDGRNPNNNLSSVEVYNSRNKSWCSLPHLMSIGRSYAGVTLVD